MSCLLYAKDDDVQRQINIEDLYEKEQRRNAKLVSTFNKILNRVHKRITTVAKSKHSDKFIFFNVPEFILGEPMYDKTHCIAFIVTQLEENEFTVRYIHPNTLYVSWSQFVPSFIREQVKRRTGLVIDTQGVVLEDPSKAKERELQEQQQEQERQRQQAQDNPSVRNSKYKSTDVYKPTGQFVYGSDLFDKMEKKWS